MIKDYIRLHIATARFIKITFKKYFVMFAAKGKATWNFLLDSRVEKKWFIDVKYKIQ